MRRSTIPIRADLSELSWLAGCWRGKYDSEWGEELWSQPHSGAMVGVSRCYDEEGLRYTDLTWITQSGEKIMSMFRRYNRGYKPLCHLLEPAEFILVDKSENQAVFYSSEVDGGAWMLYERNGNRLTGRFCIGSEEGDVIRYEFAQHALA